MRFQPKSIAAVVLIFGSALGVAAQDAAFRRAAPVTMAELKALKTAGVSVVEVSDYVFGNYAGEFKSPPHADINPRKAFLGSLAGGLAQQPGARRRRRVLQKNTRATSLPSASTCGA